MEFTEKAKIRIEHWMHHNMDHGYDYESFARELEAAGKSESAVHIRKMGTLVEQSNAHLKKALEYLK